MQDNPNTYSYGNSLIHTSRKTFFDPARTQAGTPLPAPTQRRTAPVVKKITPTTGITPCRNCPIQDENVRE